MTADTSMSDSDGPRDAYSHGHHESVLRSHRWRTAENSAGYLLPHLAPDHRLLDVGVGPGTITVDLAVRLTDGTVVGIDNAPTAVEAARRLADQRKVTNVTLQLGDVYDLEFDDGTFDVVHAHQVLQHLGDPVAALREMGRLCTPDGLVAIRDADYATMTWFPESPGADPLAGPVPRHRPRQWRRAGRGPAAQGVGPRGRLHRPHGERVSLVLHLGRGSGLVVGHLGRASGQVRLRPAGRGARAVRHRGVAGFGRRLAGVGTSGRGMVHRAAWRSAVRGRRLKEPKRSTAPRTCG